VFVDRDFSRYINEYHKNGFTVIRNVVPISQIKKILSEIPKIKKKALKLNDKKNFHLTKNGQLNTIHNINSFYKGREINSFIKKKISKIAEKILLKKVNLRNIEFFLKPKKTGMSSPFHQDNYYWNIINSKACNIWLSCTKSNKKNGGMCYIKGSNKMGILKHEVSLAPGSSQRISLNVLDKIKLKKIYPNLNAGDCIVHHPEVIHGSNKNLSKFDRIGLVSSFKTVDAEIDKRGIKIYKKNLNTNLKKIYK
jgi:ectoine hydroxylase-related dioxygenase (phytanoyl-CoA dioxygenase family)